MSVGGGLLVQLLPGVVKGGSADSGAAAGVADPAAAAAHAAAAAAVQDVPIYSHLTRSRLSSAPAILRRITAFARDTIAAALWTLRPVRCRYALRFASTFIFLCLPLAEAPLVFIDSPITKLSVVIPKND